MQSIEIEGAEKAKSPLKEPETTAPPAKSATPTRSAQQASRVTTYGTSCLVLVVCVALLGTGIYCSTHVAAPDEWMLVIATDGQMVRSGVGMRHFAWPGEQVVKFPSSLQKVNFKAQQVTTEMQGVEVEGFAIWGVYRKDQGPFKAYSNLNGMGAEGRGQASTNLANMAESILRSQVATMTIEDVLTQRKNMRAKLTSEMMEVVQGWGIWLETVELTDVRISSDAVFKNMQSKFREEARRVAERTRLKAQEDIEAARLDTELRIDKSKAEAAKERAVYELQQQVTASEEKAAAEVRQHALDMERQARQHTLELQSRKEAAELRGVALKEELDASKQRAELEMQLKTASLDVEKGMDALNMENHRLRTMKEIYAALPLREVKIVNVGGESQGVGNATGTMGNLLLPGLAAMMQ